MTAVTVTFVFHWWYLAIALGGLGVLLAILGEWRVESFMGWSSDAPGWVNIVGYILVVVAVLFLIFGFIARALP